jgi:hypothetical protein
MAVWLILFGFITGSVIALSFALSRHLPLPRTIAGVVLLGFASMLCFVGPAITLAFMAEYGDSVGRLNLALEIIPVWLLPALLFALTAYWLLRPPCVGRQANRSQLPRK